ncbi:MAG: bifunctional glutamate N-acetyltransferase/amino-acid acetyltransferase ArgJ [Chloroflexi bacterium]|nr:bifunctional glutamate N-acetyltransferase/amino-acid acetyltransferase ArgJ [Chloroflexota bacterium]
MASIEPVVGGSVTSPRGFRAGATYCGIKKGGRDLCIIASDLPCTAAGVFTTNRVQAAPVVLTRQRLTNDRAQAVVVNSGCANACTHQRGLTDADEMTRLVAEKLGIAVDDVLVASTGVIGVYLPMEKVRRGVAGIDLTADGGADAALAILTTDTRPKRVAVRTTIGGHAVTLAGMAKGAGMIHPNMATMLSFITTDVTLTPDFARQAIRRAADVSFNAISVDGDTSTNDTLLLLANGAAGNPPIAAHDQTAAEFQAALDSVAVELAKMVVLDGEGATRIFQVDVLGARGDADARRAARAVTTSPLVKTAVHGNDPNWGRILCAVGYSGADVDPERVDLAVGDVCILRDGHLLPFDRQAASNQLRGPDVRLTVHLHLGDGRATAWGCDLSKEYVTINAEYTT